MTVDLKEILPFLAVGVQAVLVWYRVGELEKKAAANAAHIEQGAERVELLERFQSKQEERCTACEKLQDEVRRRVFNGGAK